MKALIMGCVLALSGGAAGEQKFPGHATFEPETVMALDAMQSYAFGLACEAKKMDCRGIRMPWVAYVVLPDALGQHYYGESTVQVDIRLLGQQASIVVAAHEYVHYLQYVLGQTKTGSNNYLTPCDREKEAFTLAYQISAIYGIAPADKRVTPWSVMQRAYEGCAPKPEVQHVD